MRSSESSLFIGALERDAHRRQHFLIVLHQDLAAG